MKKSLTGKVESSILSSTVEVADLNLVEDNSDRRPQDLVVTSVASTVPVD